MDARILRMKNITWKGSLFDIVATSNQLYKQCYTSKSKEDDDYYSKIVINNKTYNCTLNMTNNGFTVVLYDLEDNILFLYDDYLEEEFFLVGYYRDPKKVKNEEYRYTISVTFNERGQYYYYCQDNNIEFPTGMILYGYVTE